jgi:hypothetical protein
MEGWLEWFEERCAILEFDGGLSQAEAQARMAHIAYYLMKQTGERPDDLLGSQHAHFFLGLEYMGTRARATVEVVEYRWLHEDMGVVKPTRNFYTEDEARRTIQERLRGRVDETRRIGKRSV